jgi:hypothetical protein
MIFETVCRALCAFFYTVFVLSGLVCVGIVAGGLTSLLLGGAS